MTDVPVRPSAAALRVVPQQERGRAKLAAMLEAADRVMATEGADAVTTTRIAAEAGISIGSVYRYLPHRGAIIESLASHYLGLLEQELDALLAGGLGDVSPLIVVDAAIDAFADFYRSHPGFRVLWFERNLTAEIAELDARHKIHMAERVRDALIATGLGRRDRRTLVIGQIIHLSTDAVIQDAFRRDPEGDRAMLEQLKLQTRSYVQALIG